MSVKQTQIAYEYGLGAALLWSTVATAFKVALGFFSPLQLVLVAVLTSIFALLVILGLQQKLTLLARQLRQRPYFYLLTGILNPFAYYYVLFQAYDYVLFQAYDLLPRSTNMIA